MKKIDLGQGITILANIGVIAGILFLGYELRQNNVYLQEQARYNLFRNRLDANTFTLENPEIARLWYRQNGDSPLSDLDRERRADLLHTHLLRWQHDFSSMRLGIIDEEDFPLLGIRATWDEQGDFQEAWDRRKRGYSPDFVEWVEANVVNRE